MDSNSKSKLVFTPEMWPFKKGDLSSGIEINTFMISCKSSIGLSRGVGLSSGRPLKRDRARKSRTTLQNKVRLKVLPEQLTLFVNTSVTFKKYIIQ